MVIRKDFAFPYVETITGFRVMCSLLFPYFNQDSNVLKEFNNKPFQYEIA
jgi:hypothetical protein